MTSDSTATATTHKATGIVKAVDPSKGTVTLAHGPVKKLELAGNDDELRCEGQDVLRQIRRRQESDHRFHQTGR
ncbi:copper-binding protein [Undibacterium arcticum]